MAEHLAAPATGPVRAPSGRRDAARRSPCAKLRGVSDAPMSAAAGRDLPAGGIGPEALTAADLAAHTGGQLVRDSLRPIRGAAVDSRVLRPGELFVALAGERTDGHRFLRDAVMAGAAGLVLANAPDDITLAALGDVTIVVVDDPLAALHRLAAAWRSLFRPLVIGVTGSIAKTSTKEAVATVLGARGKTLRSEGNQNNEIGLPLTLLRLAPDDVNAVLEMGMYAGGEIAELARLAQPQIGVVTAVLGVHLSRIGTIEAVENAKAELVEALPAEGVAVLNADDERVRGMARRTAARAITYGFAAHADVGAERVRSAGTAGMRFTVRIADPRGPVRLAATIPTLGRLSVHNALAGVAVGLAVGLSPEAIVGALAGGWHAPHRGELIRTGGITIVDDSYNAAPASVEAALDLLAGLPGRHVAVLGEMLELGPAGPAAHLEVGRAAARVCSLLITVGAGASEIARGAREAGMDPAAVLEIDRPAAASRIRGATRPGDVVLIKASRGIELDVLVADLVDQLGPYQA